MGTFARKQKQARYTRPEGASTQGRASAAKNRAVRSNHRLQRIIENHTTGRLPHADVENHPRITRIGPGSNSIQRKTIDEENAEEEIVQEKQHSGSRPPSTTLTIPLGINHLRRNPGKPAPHSVLAFMGPRFGRDFSPVRLHTDSAAADLSRNIGARAFTYKNAIAFGAGEFRPDTTDGRHLLAHELTHVVQQGGGARVKPGGGEGAAAGVDIAGTYRGPVPGIQREEKAPKAEKKDVTGPLTEREWDMVDISRSRGKVGIEPLTGDPAYNALTVAAEILCSRSNYESSLCLTPGVTRADPRTRRLAQHVTARGPVLNKPSLTGPLIDSEWKRVDLWLSKGKVGGETLTGDEEQNAALVAEAIFCSRFRESPEFMQSKGDPSLCVLPQVTRADPRVKKLMGHVTARGPVIHWPEVGTGNRVLYVMERLVEHYKYSVNGAAGIVGNLWAESVVLPSSVQGTVKGEKIPMKAPRFGGKMKHFTPEEVMNRSEREKKGPRAAGVGLAQWTTKDRRAGLFKHEYKGKVQGASILFNMDAQIDYMVSELQTKPHLDKALKREGIAVDSASDKILLKFEMPKAIENPLTRPTAIAERRNLAYSALKVYRAEHPKD